MVPLMKGVLTARRNSLKEKEKGFTLIELLVVIVIIGILAAIAIPVYLNVQNNAKDAAVQSDLTNSKTAVISVQTSTGTLPTQTLTTDIGNSPGGVLVVGGTGFVTAADGYTHSADIPGNITYQVTPATSTTPSSFCIAAKSVTNNIFYVTDTSGVLKAPAGGIPTTANCTPPV